MNFDKPIRNKEDDILNRHPIANQISNDLLNSLENGQDCLVLA